MMYFIANVDSRRVYIYPQATKHSACDINTRPRDSHRVVIVLEEFAHGIEGLRVHTETTEEVDEILVAHA